MLLALLFALLVRRKHDDPITNPTATLAPTPAPTILTPKPTSLSGIPSLPTVFGCTIGAVCFIALCVSYLCFRKEQQQGFAQSAQILLEKNDI